MFDYTILNVVTGLVFIFLLYSLLATAMQEAMSNLLQRRANMLQYGIKCMLTKTINNSNKSKLGLIIYYARKTIKTRWTGIMSFFVKRKKQAVHELFYNHPIIKNFGQNSVFSKPSYIGTQNFSTIIIDTLKNIDSSSIDKAADFATIKKVIGDFSTDTRVRIKDTRVSRILYTMLAIGGQNVIEDADQVNKDKPEYIKGGYVYLDKGAYAYTPAVSAANNKINDDTPIMDKETRQILNFHLNESGGDLDVFRSRLEQWFNDTMDRVTGWYKKNTHYWLFCIGMFLAVTLNIDTIEISNYLSKDKVAAERLAKMGEAAITSNDPKYKGADSTIAQEALDSIKKDIQQVNTLIGLGWGDYGRSDNAFVNELKSKSWDKKWYLFWYPFYCIELDTFALEQSKIDTVAAAYNGKIKTAADSLLSDKSRLAMKPTRRDTLKYAQDEIAYKNLLKERHYVLDSLRYRVFYDRVYKAHSIRTQMAYIISKRSWHKLFGFFITAMAIGLGAPFWYDILNKIVSVRSAGKVRNISAATSSTENKDQADG